MRNLETQNAGVTVQNTADVIATIAAVIAFASAIGVLLGAKFMMKQSDLMDRQRATDHDRSRRQEAVNMMKFWHERAYTDIGQFVAVRACLDVLSDNDCGAVEAGQELYVAEQNRETFELFFHQIKLSEKFAREGSGIKISPAQCRTLRAYIVRYMNLLEIVATSHLHHISDRKIIDEEFQHVFYKEKKFIAGPYSAATLRYPALAHMERHYEKLAEEKQKNHGKIA